MSHNSNAYLQGIVLDEETYCSFGELCRLCGASAEQIHEMVAEGIISPEGRTPAEWRFTLVSLHRVQTVVRLHQDLHINLPGCALVLELLDELDSLRSLLARS
ncbi:MAG: chaperone modulator CbpM [Desulfobulbus sp.]|jgi:chaperone modulatory protein CbpM|nr:MerR family transcriptional regulator [Desulfobulbaceae bacterium]